MDGWIADVDREQVEIRPMLLRVQQMQTTNTWRLRSSEILVLSLLKIFVCSLITFNCIDLG